MYIAEKKKNMTSNSIWVLLSFLVFYFITTIVVTAAPPQVTTPKNENIKKIEPTADNNGDHQQKKEVEKTLQFPECAPNDKRAVAVIENFKHAYGGYVKYAWKHDELRSVTNQPSDSR